MVERVRFVAQAPVAGTEAPVVPRRVDVAAPDNLPEGELGAALAKLYKGLVARKPM
jgi:hypothetical protein